MKILKIITDFILQLNWIKRILYLFLTVIFIFLLSVSVSPLHKMNEYEYLVTSDSLFLSKFDSVLSHPELSSFMKENTKVGALVKLASNDSIQLSVNLKDSSVCLNIKGVKIHESKIRQFESDKLLKKMPVIQYVKLFSEPVGVVSQFATIVKEPVVVRQAPKDTAEAALTAWKPDTLVQNPAFLLLELDYGIRIIFEQDASESSRENWVKHRFYGRIWSEKSIKALGRFFTLKKQEYYPTIKISLPVDELRAIYRALPANAQVALSF
ncbi:MAG: hypothetical protein K9H49_16530 [Bacteroidales bacterium]|nr:hypothetical protein [Bacteroidales bacterium]MCF8391775.1 hypothetical protein [Bacteroidales bacterium]